MDTQEDSKIKAINLLREWADAPYPDETVWEKDFTKRVCEFLESVDKSGGNYQCITLDKLAEDQGVRPITNIDKTFGKAAHLWEDKEDFLDFLMGIGR